MDDCGFGGWEDFLVTKYISGGVLFSIVDSYRISKEPSINNISGETIGTLCIARGEIRLSPDVECSARHNNLVFFIPVNKFYSIEASADFKGYVVLLNKSFMHNDMSMLGLRPHMLPDNVPSPFYTISDQERQTLTEGYNRLERYFEREDHRFYRQTIKLAVMDLFCETLNIICNNNPTITFDKPARGRHDQLCRRFMDLLCDNVRSNHDVAYYADRLCITPQYLTKITKERFGRTAGRMIDNALMREATIMLRSTDMSMAEIADRLSFADGASFSKFFTKHEGVSPSQYRKKL